MIWLLSAVQIKSPAAAGDRTALLQDYPDPIVLVQTLYLLGPLKENIDRHRVFRAVEIIRITNGG
jgi:phosphoribosyl-dephospho-CoA transferase